MKNITISLSNRDIETLKRLSVLKGTDEILDNIISKVEKEIERSTKELTIFQISILKVLLQTQDIPLTILNSEDQTGLEELEQLGILTISKFSDIQIVHLNFKYDNKKFSTIESIFEELKKRFNLK